MGIKWPWQHELPVVKAYTRYSPIEEPESKVVADVMQRLTGAELVREFRCRKCGTVMHLTGKFGPFNKPDCTNCGTDMDVQCVKIETNEDKSSSPFTSSYPWTPGTGFGSKYTNP